MPGASTEWITAHVAFVVEAVPELHDACATAATYLAKSDPRRGGWAWNLRSNVDVDSTTNALLVLHRFGIAYDTPILEQLLRSQHQHGGFPTYVARGGGSTGVGWHAPHPDVTAVVIELLRRLGGPVEPQHQAERWLHDQLVDGALPGYWWHGWGYGLWLQSRIGLRTREASDAARRLLDRAEGAPELALLLAAAAASELGQDRVWESAQRLIRAQRVDGSWGCQRCLRVTSTRQYEAGPYLPGRVYADNRRVFSTAHAVAALSAVRDRLKG